MENFISFVYYNEFFAQVLKLAIVILSSLQVIRSQDLLHCSTPTTIYIRWMLLKLFFHLLCMYLLKVCIYKYSKCTWSFTVVSFHTQTHTCTLCCTYRLIVSFAGRETKICIHHMPFHEHRLRFSTIELNKMEKTSDMHAYTNTNTNTYIHK